MKLKEKAWGLYLGDIEDGYLYDDVIVYAENRNKAKSKMLYEVKLYHNIRLKNGGDITYLNVPLQRLKSVDKYEFEGKVLSKFDIEEINWKRTRNAAVDKIVQENLDAKCYVLKGGLYWRPCSCGYTEYRQKAGIYDIQEAAQIVKNSSKDRFERMLVIDKDEHNKYIQEQIDDLKTRLI